MLRVLCGLVLFLGPTKAQQRPEKSPPNSEALIESGRQEFETLCAWCHGADGKGGVRGPSIAGRESGRVHSERDLRELIRKGVPEAGMPALPLPKQTMDQLVAFVRSLTTPAIERDVPGDVSLGRRFFFGSGNCASCHMAEGWGGVIGPDLTNIGRERTLAEIEQALHEPEARGVPGYQVVQVQLHDGTSIRALVKNESNYDLQLQSLDGRLHLLRSDQIASIVREEKSLMPSVNANEEEMRNLLAYLSRLSETSFQAASEEKMPLYSQEAFAAGDWPTYHGHPSGNRHSSLRQIHTGNVAGLAPKWIFPIRGTARLEVTLVVVGGVMYVTSVNQVYALDARAGRQIWSYRRPRTEGLVGDAAGGINRGVAVLGDRVFVVTDNAHLVALKPSQWRSALGRGNGRCPPALRCDIGAAGGQRSGDLWYLRG